MPAVYTLATGELPDLLDGTCRDVQYLLMNTFGVHLFYEYSPPIIAPEKRCRNRNR